MKEALIVGAGPAGYFAAIRAKEVHPLLDVQLIEAGDRPLRKVKISGGGRCNVTHACFDPAELVKRYPRGSRELRGPFSRFQPQDTVEWFESRGVKLKAEPDGRMFPVSDSSQSIIDCLERERKRHGVELKTNTKLVRVRKDVSGGFVTTLSKNGQEFEQSSEALIISTGSAESAYGIVRELGHTITPTAPSLFTFNITDPLIEGLSGVSVVDVGLQLKVGGVKPFKERGPLLITHWGLSGPAVIRLSAWAARELEASNYQAELVIDWNPGSFEASALPRRLETRLEELKRDRRRTVFAVSGKGVFKEEFVTCGGVSLKEVDFRTMQSKIVPGLFFAGEILDIDGITGGFNFQSSWTTGWIAGGSLREGRA
jgi:predicted Rossmann fold flavoprotein